MDISAWILNEFREDSAGDDADDVVGNEDDNVDEEEECPEFTRVNRDRRESDVINDADQENNREQVEGNAECTFFHE